MFNIPKQARPHEVAILMLFIEGKNSKTIAWELHYQHVQPVNRVIKKWKRELELLGSATTLQTTSRQI